MVVHELLTRQLVQPAHEGERVRRVMGVDDVESPFAQHAHREGERGKRGVGVVHEVAEDTAAARRAPVAVHRDAVEILAGGLPR